MPRSAPHAAVVAVFALMLTGCKGAAQLLGLGGTCNGPVTVTASGSVSGSTASTSCKLPDGSTGVLHTLTAAQPTNVEFTVAPNGFSPYLGAWTSTGTLLGQTTSSPARLRLFLAPGSYQIGVAAVSKDGSFTLTSAPAAVASCLAGAGGSLVGDDLGITMKGASISGSLTSADCGNQSGMRSDGYLIAGVTAGTTFTVTLTTDRAANGEVWVGSQSVAGKGLNGAGTWTQTVNATSSGDWRVFVAGTPGSGVINYTLTIN